MKLSWSHKLFLKVNALVGKSPRLDKLMYFFGFWLIYFCIGAFFVFLGFAAVTQSFRFAVDIFGTLVLSALIAYGISYSLAIFFPHKRPEKELPQVKKLFQTLGTWKSFPSDHTIAVFLIALVVSFFTTSLLLSGIFFIAAVGVAFGRVYSGVHYPRDILGGILVSVISFGVILYFL